MKISSQSINQIDRAINRIAAKFPSTEEASIVTDIHLQVNQESGELLAFDDDDNELNRAVIEDWINSKNENFYQNAAKIIKERLNANKEVVDKMSILQPYSFVLIDDDKETIEELHIVDDDTMMLNDELLKGLDKELDDFLKNLLEE